MFAMVAMRQADFQLVFTKRDHHQQKRFADFQTVHLQYFVAIQKDRLAVIAVVVKH